VAAAVARGRRRRYPSDAAARLTLGSDRQVAARRRPGGSHGAHGLVGLERRVPRLGADPNTIVIVNDSATLEGAVAFTKDPSLPAAMAKGGVTGAPQVWIADEVDAAAY